tara:strand:- start:8561 stop:9106 length:546 start_codon:yes stop_codon:yes gene_type:complete
MKPHSFFSTAAPAALLLILVSVLGAQEPNRATPKAGVSVDEARRQARLLHEALHGALQVMHRDFFDPDERDRIPSASLEDVFEVMAKERGIKLSWMGVNATMDDAHEPTTPFEKSAAQKLEKGSPEVETVDNGWFRFVGAVQLHNQCLKCHVPYRTSLEDRVAGLKIEIPIADSQRKTEPN